MVIALSDYPIIKRSKLKQIGSYITLVEDLDSETIWGYIINTLRRPHPSPVPAPEPPTTCGTGAAIPDPTRGAPKINVNPLKEFTGIPMDF